MEMTTFRLKTAPMSSLKGFTLRNSRSNSNGSLKLRYLK